MCVCVCVCVDPGSGSRARDDVARAFAVVNDIAEEEEEEDHSIVILEQNSRAPSLHGLLCRGQIPAVHAAALNALDPVSSSVHQTCWRTRQRFPFHTFGSETTMLCC
jgi:hypothetical protein